MRTPKARACALSRRWPSRHLAVLVVAVALLVAPQATLAGPAGEALLAAAQPVIDPMTGEPLGPSLRQGGYVIFLRHAQEEGTDRDPIDLRDCGTQQTLSDEGRAQAQAIGEAFRSLGIPVGEVKTSELCRAWMTAAFSLGAAAMEPMLNLPGTLDPAVREGQTDAVAALLTTMPVPGANTVLVSHANLLTSVVGFGVERAEAAIFAPDGVGGTVFVTKVAWDQWRSVVGE